MYEDMDEDCRYWMARGASILQNPSAHCAQVPENPNGRVREGYRRELVARRIPADLTLPHRQAPPLLPSRIVPC